MKEQEQYLGLLTQLKDYDEALAQELAAKAYQEQERQKLEVSIVIVQKSHCCPCSLRKRHSAAP